MAEGDKGTATSRLPLGGGQASCRAVHEAHAVLPGLCGIACPKKVATAPGWFEAFSCESRCPLRSGGTWCWWHFACAPQAQGPRQQMTACRHLGSQAQVEAGGLRVLDLLQLPEAVRSTPRWSPHAAAGRLSRSLAGWNKSRTCVHRCAWLLPSISFHRESFRTVLCVLS